MHIPVLLQESVAALDIHSDGTYIDGTLGGAGHALEITKHLGPNGTLIGFDLDSNALARAEQKLTEAPCKKILVRENFRNLDAVLSQHHIESVDGILLDLGFSSFQIEDAERGLSFQHDGPLHMTLKDNPTDEDITAWDIVNEWEESTIADLIYAYGDESASRKIARAIVASRKTGPINTTFDLKNIIESILPKKAWMRTHPATKTFQALRIAVNDEYGAIKEVLEKGFDALNDQGMFSIITFHSGEDRIVKNYFRDQAHNNLAELVTKKPIKPSAQEVSSNPRARSAQLRIIKKLTS